MQHNLNSLIANAPQFDQTKERSDKLKNQAD